MPHTSAAHLSRSWKTRQPLHNDGPSTLPVTTCAPRQCKSGRPTIHGSQAAATERQKRYTKRSQHAKCTPSTHQNHGDHFPDSLFPTPPASPRSPSHKIKTGQAPTEALPAIHSLCRTLPRGTPTKRENTHDAPRRATPSDNHIHPSRQSTREHMTIYDDNTSP